MERGDRKMKRVLIITLLVVSMLAMVGFSPVEATYWEDLKEIYKWDAMEGESEAELNIFFPDMDIDCQYKIYTNSKLSFDDFSSYSEVKVEDLQGQSAIPVIKMYTYGQDLYINKEAVLALLSAINMADGVEIKEEFIMLENKQNNIEVDFNKMLNDVIELVDKIDFGIDFNMEKEGSTYTLTLEAEELIDIFDAYIRYIIENIDQLPDSLMQGQEIEITEEEKQQALEQYNSFVNQYKDMAKSFTKGSKYYMESTFGKNKYSESSQLDIKTPMGELNVKTKSTTSRLETSDIELPTSVLKITAEELEQLIADKIGANTDLKVVMELDGTYVKFGETGLEEGQIPLKIEDGISYITIEDAEKLFDVKLENIEDPFHIRQLDNYGFRVDWNEEFRLIEVY